MVSIHLSSVAGGALVKADLSALQAAAGMAMMTIRAMRRDFRNIVCSFSDAWETGRRAGLFPGFFVGIKCMEAG